MISLTYLQEEKEDETGWTEPAGFHLIPLPFVDDIRSAPIQEGFQGALFFWSLPNVELIGLHPEPASEEMRDAAFAWIDKLSVKNGTYPPDSYPNPGEIVFFHATQRSHDTQPLHTTTNNSRQARFVNNMIPNRLRI